MGISRKDILLSFVYKNPQPLQTFINEIMPHETCACLVKLRIKLNLLVNATKQSAEEYVRMYERIIPYTDMETVYLLVYIYANGLDVEATMNNLFDAKEKMSDAYYKGSCEVYQALYEMSKEVSWTYNGHELILVKG